MEAELVDQPGLDVPQTDEAIPSVPPELSIADHGKVYGPEADKEDPEAPEGETPAEKAERLHHSAEQRRAKTGEFAPGKVRHRAESQKAKPEDVGRIGKLTAKLRAAEEELAQLRRQSAPPAQIARATERVETAAKKADDADPEPREDDKKYEGAYDKYLADQARWAARDEYRKIQQRYQQHQHQARQRQEATKTLMTWGERVQQATSKYPDYEAVALRGSARIPVGSLVDTFIMEDDAGAEILYHMNQHPDELDTILRMPVLQQTKHLALLSQRLVSSTSPMQAGSTGSAAGRKPIVSLPPRPPNPVRTEAQRATSDPAPTDGSLSIAEHRKAFGARR